MIRSVDINALAHAIIRAMPKSDNILTVEKVADILGRSVEAVNEMCNKGIIPAKKLGNGRQWYISERKLKESLFGND